MKHNIIEWGLIGLVLLLSLRLALAEEAFSQVEGVPVTEAEITHGTEPTGWSYRIQNAWGHLGYLLTFNKAEKAKKGLQLAHQQLWEVKFFSEQKQLDKAEAAQVRYAEWISRVKEDMEDLSSEDAKAELKKSLELEAALQKEEVLVSQIKQELVVSPGFSEQEKVRVGSLLDKVEEKKEEVKQVVEEKKGMASTKFKARFGLKDKELKREVKKLRAELGTREEAPREAEQVVAKEAVQDAQARGVNKEGEEKEHRKLDKETTERSPEREEKQKEEKEESSKEEEVMTGAVVGISIAGKSSDVVEVEEFNPEQYKGKKFRYNQ